MLQADSIQQPLVIRIYQSADAQLVSQCRIDPFAFLRKGLPMDLPSPVILPELVGLFQQALHTQSKFPCPPPLGFHHFLDM